MSRIAAFARAEQAQAVEQVRGIIDASRRNLARLSQDPQKDADDARAIEDARRFLDNLSVEI